MEHFQAVLDGLGSAWRSEERKWFVSFRNPVAIWRENPTFLMLEAVTYLWAFLLFKHARKHGGRLWYLLFASMLHGAVVECLSYTLPDIDSFWHGVSSIIFFNQRLPLHAVLFYPCFHYTSNVAISRLRLPWWSEPFAVALADLCLDIPFDILGIKLLWWTWHDTDPNIFDRTYSVPLTSYLFHLTFASSFSFLLSGSRWLLTGSRDQVKRAGDFFTEMLCLTLTGVFSMPVAVLLQIVPLYNVFHDLFSVHTEVCVWIMLGLYSVLAWTGDRISRMETKTNSQNTGRARRSNFDEISLSVLVHFVFYIFLVFCADPASYRSTGPHELVGNCSETTTIDTLLSVMGGPSLTKKKYLCVDSYDEPYFDFHCLNKPPSAGAGHYTICGTHYDNHVEYQLVIASTCLLGLLFYHQLLFKSGKMSGSGGGGGGGGGKLKKS